MRRVEPLLKGVELTPGQVAELRAIDALYYTSLADAPGALDDRARDARVLARVRDMLDQKQRATFDRNRALHGTRIEQPR